MLYLYRRVAFGELVHEDVKAMPDLSKRRNGIARSNCCRGDVDGCLSGKLHGPDPW